MTIPEYIKNAIIQSVKAAQKAHHYNFIVSDYFEELLEDKYDDDTLLYFEITCMECAENSPNKTVERIEKAFNDIVGKGE